MPDVSPNFGERRGGVSPSLIVLHYTGMQSCQAAFDRLCDPSAEVSAHYLISETGRVHALVPEPMRAWHAGQGAWAGIDDINSHSIGIELANPGDAPFAAPQMLALERLLAEIVVRWSIAAHRVICHSDMAPLRKRDPGPRFDWRRLARARLSVWPDDAATTPAPGLATPAAFDQAALRFGYPAGVGHAALLAAFRARFRPCAVGDVDAQDIAVMRQLGDTYPVDPRPPAP